MAGSIRPVMYRAVLAYPLMSSVLMGASSLQLNQVWIGAMPQPSEQDLVGQR